MCLLRNLLLALFSVAALTPRVADAGFVHKAGIGGTGLMLAGNFPVPVIMEMDGDPSGPEVIVIAYCEGGMCDVGMTHISTGLTEWIHFEDWIVPPDRVYYLDVDNDGLLDALVQNGGIIEVLGWSSTAAAPSEISERTIRPTPGVIPNPTPDRCLVKFSISQPGMVSVNIFDPAGRRVREILSGRLPAGSYAPIWDGHDDSGRRLPSGVYFARIENPEGEQGIKLVLAR